MKKYNKVTDEQVLETWYKIHKKYWEVDFIPIHYMCEELKTSEYQVRKAYKNLEKLGYMKKEEVPTYCEEYFNGLYDETIVVLKTKAFSITNDGIKAIEERRGEYE